MRKTLACLRQEGDLVAVTVCMRDAVGDEAESDRSQSYAGADS